MSNGSDFLDYLGNIEEKLKENHSSELLFNSVDHCLMKAVYSLLDSTFLVEELLNYIKTSPTKKIMYNVDADLYDEMVYGFFIARSKRKKIKALQRIKLNRDLYCFLIDRYLEEMEKVAQCVESCEEIKSSIRLKNKPIFDHLLNLERCKFWFSTYRKMRETICEKYYRHIKQNVGKIPYSVRQRFSDEDIAMEYYLNLTRAFNRYDIASGTFTSFVNNWFKYAKSRTFELDEIGNAFTVPTNVRIAIAQGKSPVVNYSSEIDENIHTDEDSYNRDVSDFIDEDMLVIMEMLDSNNLYRLLKDYTLNDHRVLECWGTFK